MRRLPCRGAMWTRRNPIRANTDACVEISDALKLEEESRAVLVKNMYRLRALRLSRGSRSMQIRAITERQVMDWNRVEGNWKQVRGKVKESGASSLMTTSTSSTA